MKTSFSVVCLIALAIALPGCQSLQQFAALRSVDFDLDRVANAELAGINVSRVRGYNDLAAADLLRLGAALAQGDLPLEFTLHLAAENPETNSVDARLLEMDWTLFIEDRETVSGVFDESLLLPAGRTTDIPIDIRLDLVEFFDRNLSDMVQLALAVSGQGGEPKNIKVRIQPTIDTPLGPIRYPEPITVVSRDVGASASR